MAGRRLLTELPRLLRSERKRTDALLCGCRYGCRAGTPKARSRLRDYAESAPAETWGTVWHGVNTTRCKQRLAQCQITSVTQRVGVTVHAQRVKHVRPWDRSPGKDLVLSAPACTHQGAARPHNVISPVTLRLCLAPQCYASAATLLKDGQLRTVPYRRWF